MGTIINEGSECIESTVGIGRLCPSCGIRWRWRVVTVKLLLIGGSQNLRHRVGVVPGRICRSRRAYERILKSRIGWSRITYTLYWSSIGWPISIGRRVGCLRRIVSWSTWNQLITEIEKRPSVFEMTINKNLTYDCRPVLSKFAVAFGCASPRCAETEELSKSEKNLYVRLHAQLTYL